MRRIALISLSLLFLLVPQARSRDDQELPPELVARTGPRTPEAERSGFHLPPGFEIQLVASDPDIHKPMNIAFDDRGRLWVTETIEYPFPAKDGAHPRDGVKILEDFGPDGRARKITTFTDGLNIPIGLLPMPGGREALVHAIPEIDRHADTDGDGKADRRELGYKTFGSRDTHGMTNAFNWGVDGWIYACHGFNNESDVKGKDGRAIVMQSGNTYRMKADGSHAEQFTHGQVNPFGLCFDPLGNLYSADCHSKPVYLLLRNAYYPSFGKPHDGLGFAPEMVQHDHGSTAISGVVYYAAEEFPAGFRGNVFIGNVVTNRINRDTIDWHGSTPKGVMQPDFLSSDDPWFRPVDLKLGPDGALYVADFYNKIIGHYEVPLTHPGRDRERGRIWRIVYRGADGKAAVPPLPNFASMTASDLVNELSGPNFARRIFATNQLAARGGTEVIDRLKGLPTQAPEAARVHAMWILERLGALADDRLADAMKDASRDVRTHARKVVAERSSPSPDLLAATRAGLGDPDAFVRRASADSLGRHPGAANVRALLDARHAAPAADEAMVHVVRMALRDQLATASLWPSLADKAYSEADFRALADVALGVPSRESADYVARFLAKYPEDPALLMDHLHHVARRGDVATDGLMLTFAQSHRPDDLGAQAEMVKAVHTGLQERGAPFVGMARDWSSDVAGRLLRSDKADAVGRGIDLTETLRLRGNRDLVAAIARTQDRPEPLRIAAANAIAALDPTTATEPLASLAAEATAPNGLREAAIVALGKANQEASRAALVAMLATAPDRLQTTLAAALAANKTGAEALLNAVASGKASARLLQERAVRVWLDQSGLPGLADRVAKLTEGLAPGDARIAEVLDRRRVAFAGAHPDASRGEESFRKNCALCHQIGGQGARIGPQLDGIGSRGGDRLVEDILDPNRNIDQAFRLSTLALSDGRVLSGLLLREEGDVLILADSQGKEQRVTRDSVEQRKISPVSPMPADFAEKIPEAEFFDLISYLITRKGDTAAKGPAAK